MSVDLREGPDRIESLTYHYLVENEYQQFVLPAPDEYQIWRVTWPDLRDEAADRSFFVQDVVFDPATGEMYRKPHGNGYGAALSQCLTDNAVFDQAIPPEIAALADQ